MPQLHNALSRFHHFPSFCKRKTNPHTSRKSTLEPLPNSRGGDPPPPPKREECDHQTRERTSGPTNMWRRPFPLRMQGWLPPHPPSLLDSLLQEAWFLSSFGLRQLKPRKHESGDHLPPTSTASMTKHARLPGPNNSGSVRRLALERTAPSVSAAPTWGIPSP